jgi:hypothetical protein
MSNIIEPLGERNIIALHRPPEEIIAAGNRIVADSKRACREAAGWLHNPVWRSLGPRAGARDSASWRESHEREHE